MDGVRRWFQRRPTSVTSTNLATSNNSSSVNDQNPNLVFKENQHHQQQGDTVIEDDFDISGLEEIKVPKRVYFPFLSSTMDSHKKVAYLLLYVRFRMCIV